MEIIGLSMHIVNVDQLDNGVLVNFEDGVCAFFEAAFLYTQMDKRVAVDFSDTSSTPPAPDGR